VPSPSKDLQFGVFLPIINGGWIASTTAPKVDGSFDLNKRTAILAEEIGMDFVLSMMKWRGFGGAANHWGYSVESMMLMSALSQVTARVKLWCTVHSLLFHPAVVAKMVATLDHASNGRAGLNIVSGSYRDEFVQMGMWPKDLDHDARYALADEWITVVKRLWTEQRVDFDGRFFKLADCVSDPKPLAKPYPTLICAGISDAGFRMTAKHADASFVTGKDDAELAINSRRAKTIAREYGKSIKTFIYCCIVPGATDAEAEARVRLYREGVDPETIAGMTDAYQHTPRYDGKINTMVLRAEKHAFQTAVIAGSAERIQHQIVETIRTADLDGMMLIFPDFIEDQRFFGERILPGIRRALA
jgi:pyrimidine oxygenase